MSIQTLFDKIGSGIHKGMDSYKKSNRINLVVNTAMIYGSLALGPDIVGANQNTKDICDMFAPVISGSYALRSTRNEKNENWKPIMQIAISGLIGYDLFNEINNYTGSIGMIHSIDSVIDSGKNALSKLSGTYVSNGCTGGVTGVVSAIGAKIAQAYSRTKKSAQSSK
ncbi:MAG: hypothetical protein U9R34_02545 [Nanoarchaeota archaeon]|nr:hypothetical protein [Nanoarchaeota archaeon]